jgi:RHS repeat-associated protein
VYGEGQGDTDNHRTLVYQVFDGAGVVTSEAYDFKGNVLRTKRDLLPDYKNNVDWQQNPAPNDGTFAGSTAYDALNRATAVTAPDKSVYRPTYNEANLLDKVHVNLRGAAVATPFVTDIDYDAKGQRILIRYANSAETTYAYDEQTFRLVHLKTTRELGLNGLASQIFKDAAIVQDLCYTYDPAGNITRIEDAALKTITHDGEIIEPACSYTYDALYRLIEAKGREHIGQTAFQPNPPSGNCRDYPFTGHSANPNDLQALRNYTERYEYDVVGNLDRMIHQAKNGDWTRDYEYDKVSVIEPVKKSNRLSHTTIGQMSETYTYDAHGNMLNMPHLVLMTWDFEDQLQRVDLGGGGTACYVYDAAGQRVRKVIERQNGTRQHERIYLGGFELYREYDGVGSSVSLERETLHIMDDQQRIALVETKTIDIASPLTPHPSLVCYQFGNHLGSASLELDEAGQMISYEEYHPYGTTSYQAVRSDIEASPKRYRYTGKERDEETGFNYHGARYYAPWLGRWASVDPIGIGDGVNVYQYVANNPTAYVDQAGFQRGLKEWEHYRHDPAQPTPDQIAELYGDERLSGDEEVFASGKSPGTLIEFPEGEHIQGKPAFNLRSTGSLELDRALTQSLQQGGYSVSVAPQYSYVELPPDQSINPLDAMQTSLDLIGTVPALGEPADLSNAIISLLRGNYADATLSVGAAVPVFGWGAVGAKWARKTSDVLDVAKDISKAADAPTSWAADRAKQEAAKAGTSLTARGPRADETEAIRRYLDEYSKSQDPGKAGTALHDFYGAPRGGRGKGGLDLDLPGYTLELKTKNPWGLVSAIDLKAASEQSLRLELKRRATASGDASGLVKIRIVKYFEIGSGNIYLHH